MTASASRLPSFTFPSLPVRQWVLISHQTPIGRRREPPGQTTLPFPPHGRRDLPIQIASIFLRSDVGESLPATQLVFCLYLSNTASLDLPLDAGASSPARQPYLSNLLLDEAYPSDTVIPKPVGRRREPPGQTALPFQTYCSTRLTRPARWYRNQSDVGESLRDRQLSFSILRLARPTQPRCRLTVRPSNPLNFALLSKPSDSASPDLPTDAGESTPGQTILSFQVHARRGLPVRHGSSETTVGRRREPLGQTILLFQVLSSARLTRPTRRLLKPPSDVGESLPARQSYLSSLTLGEAYPSNTAGIVPPLDVGESLPARQTHPFRLLAPRRRTLRARPFRQP